MNKVLSAYALRLLGQQTALIMTMYESDYYLISDMYDEMIIDVTENKDIGYMNYITKLIGYLVKKEEYERCSQLLKIKNKISELNNG